MMPLPKAVSASPITLPVLFLTPDASLRFWNLSRESFPVLQYLHYSS